VRLTAVPRDAARPRTVLLVVSVIAALLAIFVSVPASHAEDIDDKVENAQDDLAAANKAVSKANAALEAARTQLPAAQAALREARAELAKAQKIEAAAAAAAEQATADALAAEQAVAEAEALIVAKDGEIGDLARAFRDMRLQISEQISELRDNQDELEHLAQHDPLTGLPNRRKFQERLDQALAQARRFPQTVSVLFIDLDRFKIINDRHGHEVGDVVLQTVARRLQAVLREVDTVARIGGDEFVALLGAPATPEQLDAIANKLLQVLGEPVRFEGLQLDLGCSIGIASYPNDAGNATDLLAAADHAMYAAKTAGRNTHRFFDAASPAA